LFFDNFFSIKQGPSNAGKLNWDLPGFFSFIHPSLKSCTANIFVVGALYSLLAQSQFSISVFFISAASASIQFGCGGYFSDFQDTNMCTGLLWLSENHFFYYDKT
jgi:hypothetical protein